MYNITIDRDEIAFLRGSIAKKYCSAIQEEPTQFLERITGTLKHYEAIGDVMRDYVQDEQRVSAYASFLSESPFKITLRKWVNQRDDERKKKLSELAFSISGNVLRKLIFYGLQEKEQTFKDAFIMACYIYTGVDRSERLSRKPAGTSHPAPSKQALTLTREDYTKNQTVTPNKTVAPYHAPKKCTLTAIDDNEQPLDERLEMEFNGQPIILNRENLGPGNNTITSQVQASILFRDGRWQLENGSRYKTTYIQVIRAATIQPGDIIVFGNKRFVFLEE